MRLGSKIMPSDNVLISPFFLLPQYLTLLRVGNPHHSFPPSLSDSSTQPAPGMESLPEAVLIRILASVPAVDLVLVCRLVCCQWKNLVDGAALWILKCQQEGLTRAESDAENWQNFYFLSKKRKNLIKNPCGEGERYHKPQGVREMTSH